MCDSAQLLPELHIDWDPLFPPVTYLWSKPVNNCFIAAKIVIAHNGNVGCLQTQFQLEVAIIVTLSLPSVSSNKEGAGVGDPIE